MVSLAPMGLAALVAFVTGGPGEQARFRVSTQIVEVDVFVGRDGRAIVGLGADDFELYDDGERQDIELVDIRTLPLHIAIVLDASNSVRGARLAQLKQAAHRFLDELSDEDRVAVISFSHQLSRPTPLTAVTPELHAAIEAVDGYGATAWHDALYAGLKTVEDVPRRPMVLLFTDGEDTYSWLREDQMRPLVERSSAVIYAVVREDGRPRFEIGQSDLRRRRAWRRDREEHTRRTRFRRELTEASGGRLLEMSSMEELQDAFLEVLQEMRTRYLLAYYRPSGTLREGWHEIEVKVKRRGADVRARRGYFYEGR